MTAERDLDTLRANMSPSLNPQACVYCCVAEHAAPAGLQSIATFREAEGLTLIVPKEQAIAAGLSYQFECAWITLNVLSSLEAVGFIAIISHVLAREGIPCNVVSAYHHDHLFVPFEAGERVMRLLNQLATAE